MVFRFVMAALGIVALLSLGVSASGCGGGDDSSTSSTAASSEAGTAASGNAPAATTTADAGGPSIEIKMADYSYAPSTVNAKAGTVTIDAPNDGSLPHELVLAKTNADPAGLPTAGDGLVDEASLDSPGEIGEVAAGSTGSVTLDLKPGKYVMFCNLAGHYAAGMYGSLIVK